MGTLLMDEILYHLGALKVILGGARFPASTVYGYWFKFPIIRGPIFGFPL